MNWGCRIAKPFNLVAIEGDYYGHTLEYVRGTAMSGWHCQWCGESFKTAEEHQHAGFPPMEVIETEEPSETVVAMMELMIYLDEIEKDFTEVESLIFGDEVVL